MEQKLYRYFVSYSFASKNGSSGFGNLELRRSEPITNIHDIMEVANGIRAEKGFDALTILYYTDFKDN